MRAFALIVFVLTALPALVSAQADPVRAFVQKHRHLAEAEHINLGGFLLQIAANHTDDEDAALLLSKISHLRVFTVENSAAIAPAEVLGLRQSLRAKSFEDLLFVRDGLDKIDIMIRETPEAITDVVLLIQEPEGFTLLSLEGWLRYDDLRRLNIDVDGMAYLSELPEERP
jgi:hypothetical protein